MKKSMFALLIILFIFNQPLFSKNYKGAEYRTKESFTYGRFEMRLKAAQREGMLSSFFTYYDGGGGTATWNEIDIEIMGRYDNSVQFNTITPGQINHVRSQFVNFNPAVDFHIYAIEWTPAYVAWFIDGSEVYRQTGSHIQSLTRAQKLMMNIWNPSAVSWAGVLSDNALPAIASYDWVSVYSYTPGSGNYGSGNNFTLKWKDEFNSWDTSRWDKATHTWDGNNCDFVFDNAAFKDGTMNLCLTDNINLGLADKNPPAIKWGRATKEKVTISFSEELEQSAAENIGNYSLAGVAITKASLLDDKKTVQLDINGIDLSVTNTLVVRNIKDTRSPANILAVRSINLIASHPLTFPVKINLGGGGAYDFMMDQQWKPETEYGYSDAQKGQYPYSTPIRGTIVPNVYRTELKDFVFYKVRVPDGVYNVKLMLAENYFSQAGQRIFDVWVEGKSVAKNLDIFKEAGKNNAYDLSISNVSVTDGILEVNMSPQVDYAILNGITIEQVSTGVLNEPDSSPSEFSMCQNFPNPFNGMTVIKYNMPKSDNVSFSVHNSLGQEVYVKNLGIVEAGINEFHWNAVDSAGNHISSGMYIYSLKGNSVSLSKKMILLN
ncbi:MAG: family 16 glycosylhydrolase [Methanococcaceae archaeon]